jgi:Family of unknown function (DUF6011)
MTTATKSRKGWAALGEFGKQYRWPDGEWRRVTCFEDIDALEAAWAEHDKIERPVEEFAPNTGGHAEAKPDPIRSARQAEALAYVRDYSGTWGLPLDIRADRRWGTKHMRLSDRQIEVLLAGKARDAARKVERKQTGRDLLALPTGRTCAAVDNDSGGLTFLLIDVPAELDRYKAPNRWHGWAFVKQQQGPNEVKIGSQRPGETYSGQWANLIDRVLADPLAAIRRYGLELGVCGVCQLPLTNGESREKGIGPVCETKMNERFPG